MKKIYNGEHYEDPTAHEAVWNLRNSQRQDDMQTAIAEARSALLKHGFDTTGRVTIVDKQTGRIYYKPLKARAKKVET